MKWLRNPFYRKVAFFTLAILVVALLIALVQAALRDFESDMDSIFPGGQTDDDQWYEPVPTRDGLPRLDDDQLTW